MSNNNNLVLLADKLNNLMKTHSDKEVESNAIQRDYIEGIITSVPVTGNIYTVLINGESHNVPCREGLALAINNIVLIALYNGDFNKKWIDLKRPW